MRGPRVGGNAGTETIIIGAGTLGLLLEAIAHGYETFHPAPILVAAATRTSSDRQGDRRNRADRTLHRHDPFQVGVDGRLLSRSHLAVTS